MPGAAAFQARFYLGSVFCRFLHEQGYVGIVKQIITQMLGCQQVVGYVGTLVDVEDTFQEEWCSLLSYEHP